MIEIALELEAVTLITGDEIPLLIVTNPIVNISWVVADISVTSVNVRVFDTIPYIW